MLIRKVLKIYQNHENLPEAHIFKYGKKKNNQIYIIDNEVD